MTKEKITEERWDYIVNAMVDKCCSAAWIQKTMHSQYEKATKEEIVEYNRQKAIEMGLIAQEA